MVEVVLFFYAFYFHRPNPPPVDDTRRPQRYAFVNKNGAAHGVYISGQGSLGTNWADYFPGLHMETAPEAATLLSGRVADQSAFIGILNQIPILDWFCCMCTAR
jgi:hypothetical protein